MASTTSTPSLDPMDFFPFRGQYGGDSAGAILFVAVRALVPVVSYSLLAPPTSNLSIFTRLPWMLPSQLLPNGDSSLPFVPLILLKAVQDITGLRPYPAIIFLGTVIPSFSFAAYNLIWRRERFPLQGQGGSFQVTTQVNLIDVLHQLIFVYSASQNPTWSPTTFKWTPAVFCLGIILHIWSDHSKYLFRRDARNKGKVYTGGPWGVVRHPNFLGFTIWRVAYATAAGGWAFGVSFLAMFAYLFYNTSVPILEDYMAKKYGKQWEVVTERVRWKFIPGVW